MLFSHENNNERGTDKSEKIDRRLLRLMVDLGKLGFTEEEIVMVDPAVLDLILSYEDPEKGLPESMGLSKKEKPKVRKAETVRAPTGQSPLETYLEAVRRAGVEQLYEEISQDWATMRLVTRRTSVGFSDVDEGLNHDPALDRDETEAERHIVSSCYLLLDSSGSMRRSFNHTKAVLAVLAMRNWRSGGRTYYRSFTSGATNFESAHTNAEYLELMHKIIAKQPIGGTRILPALRAIKEDIGTQNLEGQVVVITDGLVDESLQVNGELDQFLPLGSADKPFPVHAVLNLPWTDFMEIITRHGGTVKVIEPHNSETDRSNMVIDSLTRLAQGKIDAWSKALVAVPEDPESEGDLGTISRLLHRTGSDELAGKLDELLPQEARERIARENLERVENVRSQKTGTIPEVIDVAPSRGVAADQVRDSELEIEKIASQIRGILEGSSKG